ncbi:MAG TPA: zinc ribbon domain-containing protein [Defluviitoga sp.]|nr:zinc ribbon domain-containing protein [Defluviitoga sp.]HOP23736.1 zinc ribbon domain-containing protein [Defluviitoga sp.]HPZ28934.1 zinc ribbon domain-containing protein [Defluviitoga sp.]HQD62978.1 zinc ribbon domain-containing protein [Defluviitoga sp.]
MPLYRYKCKKCGHEFTVLHSMNENPEIHCDLCNGDVQRMLSRVSVIFKGDGYYVTDYKKEHNHLNIDDHEFHNECENRVE